MVQLMKSGNFRSELGTAPCRDKVPVKIEIEDPLEEEHGPHNKRSKTSPTFQQWGTEANAFPIPPSQYNPLDEPSPLGLRLRKSPSLLDLIQMKLSQSQSQSQGLASTLGAAPAETCSLGLKKDGKSSAAGSIDKLKASNFPASLLKIGCWEYASRYEGDLVAKCYFAKHKLVWEVLEGGLKSKIEIQWSDIMGLTANCPDDGPGTLKVVLARQPLFFRETNPQPRKHTLWQATADFTDGQASIHRLHFMQCPQGLLNKHFEKLIQCDMRLNFLSRQPEIILESPYFEPRASVFAEVSESKSHGFDQPDIGLRSTNSVFQDVASPHSTQSSSMKIEQQDLVSRVTEHLSRDAPSPSSVMDTCAIEGNGSGEVDSHKGLRTRNWEQLKVPGLNSSMSVSDLVNHLGHCISEQITSGNPTFDEGLECHDVLEDIAQYLLSDSQFTSASDEKSIMSRVNSLCCLLQKDPATVQNLHANGEGLNDGKDVQHNYALESMHDNKIRGGVVPSEGGSKGVSGCKQAPAMSRKDSFGELLLHLPRIASLPKFLFNISEDGESHTR